MSQVIVNIIVAILGMAIGFTVCSKVVAKGLFQKFYSGFLNVTIEPEDGLYVTRTGQASERYLQVQIRSLLHQSNRSFQRGHAK